MARIQSLPKQLASHLRSTCIVSSVSQIIDELVSNSIDARAAQIRVYLSINSCYIKVEDDGVGISRDDFALLGERHATSKMHCMDELEAGPQTLGFRGEGLSSISDTGLVEVTSKARGSPHTYRKILKNCKTLSMGLTGDHRDSGTAVVVKDVFYNQPVRKKQLLASSRKALDSVKDCLLRLALVHPKICFTLVDIERQEPVFQVKIAGSLSIRIQEMLGEEILHSVQKIDFAKATLRLSGYISKQTFSNTRKALQFFYVNRRFVHKTPVHKLLNSWKKTTPTFILNLACPLADYDVTLDASKMIVEFKDWAPIMSFVEEVLNHVWGEDIRTSTNRETCSRKRKRDEAIVRAEFKSLSPEVTSVQRPTLKHGRFEPSRRRGSSAPPFSRPSKCFGRSDCYEKMRSDDVSCSEKPCDGKKPSPEASYLNEDHRKICKWKENPISTIRRTVQRPILELGFGSLSNISFVPGSLSKEMLSATRVLGQVDKKFIAAVANGTLLFIDQHAADERIRLEELRDEVLSAKDGHRKSLGEATEEVKLTRTEHETLTTYKKKVEYWGWHFLSVFSRTSQRSCPGEMCTIILNSVPCIKGVDLNANDLMEYLHQLAETHGSSAPPPAVLRVLNYKACRGAIMFGDLLLPSECEQLVNGLKKTALCFQCAHGRPTMAPIVNLKALRSHRWHLLTINKDNK